ncbi:MAG: hydrolase [Candidatus Saccharibacteria bacterium]|nr:hydrolase [Candidatus Saccharibacteria bacterium]
MSLTYCVTCAAPLTKQNDTDYVCANGHPYWNNAKAAAAVVLYRDGKVLFAVRGREPAKGKYDLPGGFTNFGEDAETAARRELQEETGLEAGELRAVATESNNYMEDVSTSDTIFLCTDWTGEPAAADDVEQLVWLPLETMDTPDFAWPYHRVYKRLRFEIDRL